MPPLVLVLKKKIIINTVMAQKTYLSREQEKAMNTFLQYKSKLQDLVKSDYQFKKNANLIETGFVIASYTPFRKSKLPREKHWAWNQSNAKITVKLPDNMVVTFRKISPRRRLPQPTPSYKIWLYHLQEPELYFLWCEKGAQKKVNLNAVCALDEGIDTEIGIIYPQCISVSSLSFLSPYVDEKVAQELGWSVVHQNQTEKPSCFLSNFVDET